MAIYCGVDFHARQQTVAYCDTTDGEIRLKELEHGRDDVRSLYSTFTGEVIVSRKGQFDTVMLANHVGGRVPHVRGAVLAA
jgi:hypothetical protein